MFEYQGEFFFKDELEQTEEEMEKMTGGTVSSIHKFLLDQIFGEKFRNYFSYVSFEYKFRALNLQTYPGYRLGQTYDITFNVSIKSNKNKIDFQQNNLVLKFTETKQYGEQEWLEKYVDYYINQSNQIWVDKYEKFNNRLLINPLATWNDDFPKTKYLEKSNPKILADISEYYTRRLSRDDTPTKWFYPEKKLTITANSYEYLGIAPESYSHEAFRAKVKLTFAYLNNPQITVTRDAELWMKYFHVQPQPW
ncbi:hypothetical protein [Spiroplasma melliferum]|uniref:Uncharacterized protein n=2 Tax=Spiroplasma melliferum TaxID=2134 RepID=A0AAI9T2H8_SPIME|nr:hypothetical protein [Spiroplasma melliferum]ELL44140.1 hypothetical protein SMIPMB4A_v3c8670 [Spiroplasma melliferum IPMB4A]KAI92271.1 hypothetical protein SPM_005990 [Spiroplasma melliferum KC3]QCO23698.1 hypothetical protein SRED_002169 [Spiroplasma melliferum]